MQRSSFPKKKIKKSKSSMNNNANQDNKYTTEEDKTLVREFDEISARPIYGWAEKTGEVRYSPKAGLLKNPPPYKKAGKKWKAILEERWEQESIGYRGDYDKDDDEKKANFKGTFNRQIDKSNRTKQWVMN